MVLGLRVPKWTLWGPHSGLESDLWLGRNRKMRFSDHDPLHGTLSSREASFRAAPAKNIRRTGWCVFTPEDEQ